MNGMNLWDCLSKKSFPVIFCVKSSGFSLEDKCLTDFSNVEMKARISVKRKPTSGS